MTYTPAASATKRASADTRPFTVLAALSARGARPREDRASLARASVPLALRTTAPSQTARRPSASAETDFLAVPPRPRDKFRYAVPRFSRAPRVRARAAPS